MCAQTETYVPKEKLDFWIVSTRQQNYHFIFLGVGLMLWFAFRFLRLSVNLSTKHVTCNNLLYEEYFVIISSRQLEVPSTARNTFTFHVSNTFWFSISSKCSLTGHLKLSFSRNDIPSKQIEFFKSSTSDPLDTMSAVFCLVGTWR